MCSLCGETEGTKDQVRLTITALPTISFACRL
jgi:hypothetical protein